LIAFLLTLSACSEPPAPAPASPPSPPSLGLFEESGDVGDAYVYGGQGTINVPSWSPDGTQVAFVSNTALDR
jgi:hypothetical protein